MDTHQQDGTTTPKKGSLKKQLSFDEKVTEFRLAASPTIENNPITNNMCDNNSKCKRKGIRWWTPSDKNIVTCFCNDTSIHGLQYLGAEGFHIGERIVWGIILVISVVTSVWLINAIFLKYYYSPVIVTFQSSEMFIGDLPYPAVTICNMNRVLKSKATQYMRIARESDENSTRVQQARQDVYYLDHVCSVSNKPFSKMFNYSMKRGAVDPELLKKVNLDKDDDNVADVKRFLAKASQKCTDMIQLCMWEGEIIDCEEFFHPIETNFGKCCTFNMVPQSLLNKYMNDNRDSRDYISLWQENDDNYNNIFGQSSSKRPRHQHRAGKPSGLSFIANPAIDEYFCSSSDAAGFQLSVHYPYDIPHVTDFGMAMRPNYEHFVSVLPDVTQADDVIRTYSIDQRKCYFENEYTLKYYNYYTPSNCLDECVANMTYEKCNCVRYYMPRDDSRDMCSPEKFACAENVKRSLYKSGVKNMCFDCLPTCREVKYSASSTLAPLQRLDLWVDDSNQTAPWAKKNISIIHVYMGEDSIYPKIRGQLYGITDLISQTGGILGLCMGFSFLSLFEIIYYFTIRPWYKTQHDKTKHRLKRHVPETINDRLEQNGNGFKQAPAEARRVTMKPGDDGKYHLQISKPPHNNGSNNVETGINGTILESPAENRSDPEDEDSNL